MSEMKYLFGVATFFAFLGFINFYLPTYMQFFNAFDFAWFGAGILGVSGACVIASGIPCAGAIAIFGFGTIFNFIVVSEQWLTVLIFTPLAITLIYLIVKLGRGGG